MIGPFLLLLSLLSQSTNPPTGQAAAPAPPTLPSVSAIREVAPGILEYNGIRLDKKNHRISFPGKVSFRDGLLEYLLVNEKGKAYESLLKTAVQPRDIHVALLLIGLKDNAKANSDAAAPPSAITQAYLQSAPKLKGPPVLLSVSWTQDGKQEEAPLEDWVLNLQTKQHMSTGPWTYNGSMVEDGVFLADQELSIVAVVTDPTALVNNTRTGYDNEDIWQAREAVVPPEDTPVEISITLAEPSTSTKP
ncbi:MAG: YdjY domain-containing protein [Methylacidiphilales bacterium]|nr:YdjY domain-containing protein [Candidatus Methylacidiphilales bacterium]